MFVRLVVICSALAGVAAAETTIVTNVAGYALTETGLQRFTRMVIVDGKVQRLLCADDGSLPNSAANRIDGEGKVLMPGLIDAHGHVLDLGRAQLQVDLRGSVSANAALDRVRAFAAASPRNRWLLGSGWNQVLWPDQQFPTAAQLDSATADRPALLLRVDGHAIWVNSAALGIAGISRATADPSGGQILRDANGDPTGVLIDAAMSLIERHVPPATDADTKRALSTALTGLTRLGLTGVHDAGVDTRTFRLYQDLGREGNLPLRVYAMLADNTSDHDGIKAGPQSPQFDDRLQLQAVKALVDGALGSRGAALLDDYSDQPQHRGLTFYSTAQLQSLAQLCGQYGWQLNVHAIGDAGNRMALDAFEHGLTAMQRTTLRPRIEHAQVISPADIPRFAALDVIASIQPTHATSDMNMAEDRLGGERIRGAYAWRKLKDAGARLAGGSDFPVELANPFHGLYAAVTRKSRDGEPPNGWYPQEKLTRIEALRLFTRDAAYAGHMEEKVGSLQPGQWADFILIDRDYFTVAEDEIDDIRVIATYVAGKKAAADAHQPFE
jgi:predicted amidohydrolase YtcJ